MSCLVTCMSHNDVFVNLIFIRRTLPAAAPPAAPWRGPAPQEMPRFCWKKGWAASETSRPLLRGRRSSWIRRNFGRRWARSVKAEWAVRRGKTWAGFPEDPDESNSSDSGQKNHTGVNDDVSIMFHYWSVPEPHFCSQSLHFLNTIHPEPPLKYLKK